MSDHELAPAEVPVSLSHCGVNLCDAKNAD
jgi:hypothetical protein